MHVMEEAPAGMILEMDAAQNMEQPGHGLGCMGIVFGFTLTSILVFYLVGYPYYHTSRAWLFWIITVGLLLANAFVIYLAVFVTAAVTHSGKTVVKR